MALKSFTQTFFDRHHPVLTAHYPGISCHRLICELEDLGEDIDGSHLPGLPFSPANIFFDSLLKGIPLEYIGRKCYFFRSYFEINEGVFIPRSETEILVEETVKELHSRYGKAFETPIKILDVGTGSGNIILSIAQEYPGAIDAVGVDISQAALDSARRNAFRLQYTFSKNKTFRFIKSDRLSEISPQCNYSHQPISKRQLTSVTAADLDEIWVRQRGASEAHMEVRRRERRGSRAQISPKVRAVTQDFHVIVSNPPYIKQNADRKNVHPQVAKWEPSPALYLEDKSYQDWFRELFRQVRSSLVKGGVFFMEGHENHLKELKHLAASMGGFTSINIKDDYTSRNRFLILRT